MKVQAAQSLAEAWDSHIVDQMGGQPLQSEEYRQRQMDYLSGAMDALTVYGVQIAVKTDNGRHRLSVPAMAETYERLFDDTSEQLQNLIKYLKDSNNAKSDNAVDDKP